jgi:hypothetical protein
LLHVFHMFWPSNLGSSCTCSLPIPGFWGGLGEANPTILRDRSTNTRNWSFTCSGTKLNVRLDHPAFTISQHMYMYIYIYICIYIYVSICHGYIVGSETSLYVGMINIGGKGIYISYIIYYIIYYIFYIISKIIYNIIY